MKPDEGASAPVLPRLVARALELGTRAGDWQSLRHGVDILRVCGNAESGPSVALLRYQPGAHVPAHRHLGFEVIYVLSGAQSDERGSLMYDLNQKCDLHGSSLAKCRAGNAMSCVLQQQPV